MSAYPLPVNVPNLFIPRNSIQFVPFITEADGSDERAVAAAWLAVGCEEEEIILAVDVELVVRERPAHRASGEGLQRHLV